MSLYIYINVTSTLGLTDFVTPHKYRMEFFYTSDSRTQQTY
jgi:hypothetical protein